jgi:dihydroorotase
MLKRILIKDAIIVNEGVEFPGSVLIEGNFISAIFKKNIPDDLLISTMIIDAKGKYLIPGIIDDQVHFREPGLTHKADIYSESKAAIAGGVTSFMDMPNTIPQTTTQALLEEKYKIASEKSLANYSFYIGATNQNIDDLLRTDTNSVCGIKVFMGSSTGNMLVDNIETLNEIFKRSPILIAVHCEDEEIIKKNFSLYVSKYGDQIPISCHPLIRSEESCYKSSSLAIQLAKKYNSRLHLLHLSTGREMELLSNQVPLSEKRITGEVCVHHLWFDNTDYERLGTKIKWNPAIKTKNDKEKLLQALLDDTIDIIATDHAPHTLEEKNNIYTKAPSGGPLIQHSLNVMLELRKQNKISLGKIVQKMCHAPADLFKIQKRGYLREGYFADIALLDLEQQWIVNKDNILYKCRWSPFEGNTFTGKVTHTFVNGNLVHESGKFKESVKGMRLMFER